MNGVLADCYSWLYQIPLSGYIRFRYITFLGISDSVISFSVYWIPLLSYHFLLYQIPIRLYNISYIRVRYINIFYTLPKDGQRTIPK